MATTTPTKKRLTRKGCLLLVLIGVIIVVGLGYGIAVGQEDFRRISCLSNLRGTCFALVMYAGDYGGEFPPDLYLLVPNKYLDAPRCFLCPSCHDPIPDNIRTRSDFVTSYLYFYHPGLKAISPEADKAIVMSDKPGNHRNYGNVVYASRRIEHFTGADWYHQAGLDQQIREGKGKMKGSDSAP